MEKRLSLRIDSEVLDKAREEAKRQGRSLNSQIVYWIQEAVRRSRRQRNAGEGGGKSL